MENSYHYEDPDLKYTNKKGLLHNLARIEDEKVLLAFESLKVTKRLEELLENPFKIKLRIHFLKFIIIYFRMFMNGQVLT